jgi:hypothetical protein
MLRYDMERFDFFPAVRPGAVTWQRIGIIG